MIKFRPLALALMTTALGACQTVPTPPVLLPAPLTIKAKVKGGQGLEIRPQVDTRASLGVERTPSLSISGPSTVGLNAQKSMPPLSGAPITASLNSMPLPAFINEAYGNLLHVNYVLDPSLAKQTDLVTLQVTDAQPPQVFFNLVDEVLRRYGIASVWDGRVLNIMLLKDAAGSESPILVSGRALPDVPESHRPVFQMIQLHSVSNGDVARWLRTAYNDNPELKIDEDSNRNAVVLSGPPQLVGDAAKAVSVLDQPYLRGRYSVRLAPAFISAAELAPRLVDTLRAEGIAASDKIAPGSSIIVLPVLAANTLLVFASDEKMLDHVITWAKTLDQPNPTSSTDSVFYYPVENTKAADIAAILNGGGGQSTSAGLTMGSASNSPATSPDAAQALPATAAKPAANASNTRSNIMVDESRNALIYRGDPAEWQRLLPLIRQMDMAARQVVIEVTIAEVTLDDSTQLGINWFAKDSHGKYDGSYQLGSLGAAGAAGSTSGLSYLVDVAGVNRAKLTAIAQHSKVNILSTPRILVKSGQEASIDVGTEVPTLTAQTSSSSQSNGNSNILQSIQYRKTGVILDVKPTVYSDNRIDLDISQEVSEAQPIDTTSGVNSPAIFQRSLKTSLSLTDGGSVVLGGLISTKQTLGDTGIPLLKDIPVVGNLFKSQSKDKTRTELLILIVPYIIDSHQQASAVTKAVIDSTTMLRQGPVVQPLPLSAAGKTLLPATPVPATTPSH